MSAKQTFRILLASVVVLLIAIVAGAYGTTKFLSGRSQNLAGLKAKNNQLISQQIQLTKDKQDIAAYKPLSDIAKSIVPQDKDQAEAVREIVNIAQASGISLAQISFPTSTLGGTNTATPGATSAPAKPTANSSLSQLTPVKGISGVYNLQIVIQNSTQNPVPYSAFLGFLSRLENNRRTSQVTGISLQPNASNPSLLSFTLIVNEYIKP